MQLKVLVTIGTERRTFHAGLASGDTLPMIEDEVERILSTEYRLPYFHLAYEGRDTWRVQVDDRRIGTVKATRC